MADYSKSRAKKKEKNTIEYDEVLSKSEKNKITKKVKKSPVLLIVLFCLVIGAVAGYFVFNYTSAFEMNSYKVNGEASQEIDYVVIERGSLQKPIALDDGGVTCKIFGIDLSKSVSVKYFYREDITRDTEEVENINLDVAGVYYIEYTSSNFLYKKTTLIRTVIVSEVENG